MTRRSRNPSEPYPVSDYAIARIRDNLIQIAQAQASSVPSYNCFLNGFELGLGLAFESQPIAEEILEAIVSMGVDPLDYEPARAYAARCAAARHLRICAVAALLMDGL